MTTELVPIPLTGEALDLTATDDTLADQFDRLKELERQLKEVRDCIAGELIRRMDSSAKWTRHAGAFKITAPSPAPKTEWDVDALRSTLADLRAEGVIDEEAEENALEVDVQFKPRVAGLNALKKLNSDVAGRIDACGTQVEAARRLTVKRAA